MTEDELGGVPQDTETEESDNTPLSLIFSGLYQGRVTLGKNAYYYAMGSNSGQSYVELAYDPAEDSSWFDETIKPLETTEVPTYYPMKGSKIGGQCDRLLLDMMHDVMEVECGWQPLLVISCPSLGGWRGRPLHGHGVAH